MHVKDDEARFLLFVQENEDWREAPLAHIAFAANIPESRAEELHKKWLHRARPSIVDHLLRKWRGRLELRALNGTLASSDPPQNDPPPAAPPTNKSAAGGSARASARQPRKKKSAPRKKGKRKKKSSPQPEQTSPGEAAGD